MTLSSELTIDQITAESASKTDDGNQTVSLIRERRLEVLRYSQKLKDQPGKQLQAESSRRQMGREKAETAEKLKRAPQVYDFYSNVREF